MTLDEKELQLHIKLLNDRARTGAFLRAIARAVRPGDVVLDLGTGTGVLAVAAARAGARRVYAVEAGAVGGVAAKVFEANGLADRITLVRSHSTRISLPEKADVLISELIGNGPLGEGVLEATADAVKRLLKPRARLVPRALKILCLPVNVPDAARRKLTFTPGLLRRWLSRYGIDFSPLGELNPRRLLVYFVGHKMVRRWKPLGGPTLLANFDLKRCGAAERVVRRSVMTANAAGVLNGLVVYFELKLCAGETIVTHPALSDRDNHWLNPIYVFVNPVPVRPGDKLNVTYTYLASGHEEWIEISNVRRAGRKS